MLPEGRTWSLPFLVKSGKTAVRKLGRIVLHKTPTQLKDESKPSKNDSFLAIIYNGIIKKGIPDNNLEIYCTIKKRIKCEYYDTKNFIELKHVQSKISKNGVYSSLVTYFLPKTLRFSWYAN